jgi:hypothetical protein
VFFTYIDRAMLDGSSEFEGATQSSRHVERVGEPYTFGFAPSELHPYLEERGYELVRDATVPQIAAGYGVEMNGYAYYRIAEARRI